MVPQPPLRVPERDNWNFFLNIPELDRRKIKVGTIRSQQIQEPLFEFSGACSGCGETPYLKLMSQLFGDRALIANATGCSSIYGGNLPTTPWSKNADGRGPSGRTHSSKTMPNLASASASPSTSKPNSPANWSNAATACSATNSSMPSSTRRKKTSPTSTISACASSN